MRAMLYGFSDELTKLARVSKMIPLAADPAVEILKQKVEEEAHKDYLRAALSGAVVAPLAGLASRGTGRFLRNRALRKAIANASPRQARKLKAELVTGPLLGAVDKRPSVSYDQLASDAIAGALGATALRGIKRSISGNSQD